VRLDEKSSAGFAVISWHDQLRLAWTGNDMRINLASSPDGSEITAKQRLDQRSYKQETTSTGDTSSTRRVALAPRSPHPGTGCTWPGRAAMRP
jgi:hypothetical protein